MSAVILCGLAATGGSDASLIAHWTFDTGFSDSVGSFGGTAAGNAQITGDAAVGSGSLLLDGDGDFVNLAALLPIGSGSSTVATWIRVPLEGTSGLGVGERVGIVLGNYSSNPNSNWELHAAGQTRVFWNNGEVNLFGLTDLRDDQWHHVAWVRNTGTSQFLTYIDGVQESLFPIGNNITFTTTHRIGGDNRDSGGGPSFHGQLDDFVIYDEALDASEVAALATTVPEASELAILCLGAFGLLGHRRRKQGRAGRMLVQ